MCHHWNVLHCWNAGSPFYQNTKQTLSDIFCRRWRKEFFPWIWKEKNIFFCEEKSFLFSILDHKEGDSFIIVSKDKYGGVALSSYILINSRPASELSLLPHTNVTSLRWWWLKYDLLLLTFFLTFALAQLSFPIFLIVADLSMLFTLCVRLYLFPWLTLTFHFATQTCTSCTECQPC